MFLFQTKQIVGSFHTKIDKGLPIRYSCCQIILFSLGKYFFGTFFYLKKDSVDWCLFVVFSLVNINKSCSKLEKVIFLIQNLCLQSARYLVFMFLLIRSGVWYLSFSPTLFYGRRKLSLLFSLFVLFSFPIKSHFLISVSHWQKNQVNNQYQQQRNV